MAGEASESVPSAQSIGGRPGKPAAGSEAVSSGLTAGQGAGSQARDDRLYDAVLHYQSGQFAEAEAIAVQLRTDWPRFFPAVLLLGMIAAKVGRPDEGIGLLQQAIALDRRSAVARNELATLLRTQGRTDEAVAQAKHAVRIEPDDAGSHNNLALCYLAAGQVPLAITHLHRAIGLMPAATMFHHNLGLALQLQTRDAEAMAAFRRAAVLDPQNAEALAHLGQLLATHGEQREAWQCYERAAAAHADPVLAALHRAEVLVQQGEAAAAETRLTEAIAANPTSDVAWQVLGVLQQRRGRFDEATASFERAIECQPKRVSAYLSLVQGKRIEPADAPLIQRMRQLVADPSLSLTEHSRLHHALGKACEDLGDYAAAIGHFDQAQASEAMQMRRAGRSFDRRGLKATVDQAIVGFIPSLLAPAGERCSPSDLPILVVGMPRSGTTLIEQILSSHGEIGGAGEQRFWTDRLALASEVLAGRLDLAAGRRLADEYLQSLRRMAPHARHVTDKMPGNFLALGTIHYLLPQARIIHCRRDPVDTCLSIWATPFGNTLDFIHDRDDLVFYYQQYLRVMAHWRAVLPADRLLDIDYEVLVAEPDRVVRQMLDFCGLTWDPACLHPEANEHIIMTPSVWQARQPIYRGSAGRADHYRRWLGVFDALRTTRPR